MLLRFYHLQLDKFFYFSNEIEFNETILYLLATVLQINESF